MWQRTGVCYNSLTDKAWPDWVWQRTLAQWQEASHSLTVLRVVELLTGFAMEWWMWLIIGCCPRPRWEGMCKITYGVLLLYLSEKFQIHKLIGPQGLGESTVSEAANSGTCPRSHLEWVSVQQRQVQPRRSDSRAHHVVSCHLSDSPGFVSMINNCENTKPCLNDTYNYLG